VGTVKGIMRGPVSPRAPLWDRELSTPVKASRNGCVATLPGVLVGAWGAGPVRPGERGSQGMLKARPSWAYARKALVERPCQLLAGLAISLTSIGAAAWCVSAHPGEVQGFLTVYCVVRGSRGSGTATEGRDAPGDLPARGRQPPSRLDLRIGCLPPRFST
jgi:hypothetical protein